MIWPHSSTDMSSIQHLLKFTFSITDISIIIKSSQQCQNELNLLCISKSQSVHASNAIRTAKKLRKCSSSSRNERLSEMILWRQQCHSQSSIIQKSFLIRAHLLLSSVMSLHALTECEWQQTVRVRLWQTRLLISLWISAWSFRTFTLRCKSASDSIMYWALLFTDNMITLFTQLSIRKICMLSADDMSTVWQLWSDCENE